MAELPGYGEALKISQSHLTPRYHELDNLERYAKGSQYEGRPSWLDPRDSIPLLERGPHVVDPIVSEALDSYCDLLVDDAHLPTYSVPDQDEQAAPIAKLDETQADALESLITAVQKQARFGKAARRSFEHAAGSRSVATLAGIKRGKLTLSSIRAKWSEPKFEKDGETVKSLEIRFPFLQRYRDDAEKRWKVRAMLYRRTIDDQRDTTYQPVKAPENGGEPDQWLVDPAKTMEHGFGFCPVSWYAFEKEDDGTETIDGRAIHEGMLSELDALHRACSQHNRAGLYCGDPQTVETGVDELENPAPIGRQARPAAVYPGESPEVAEEHRKWLTDPGTKGAGGMARKKGPGVVWRYSNEKSKVDLLTMPSDALDAVKSSADELRSIVARALAYMTPEDGPKQGERGVTLGSMSGEALKMRYRRQLARCSTYQSDFRDGWILPVTSLLLRVVRATLGKDGHYVPGADGTADLLDLFDVEVTLPDNTVDRLWMIPEMSLTWPPFFEETAVDREARSKNARGDLEAGLITKEIAVRHIKPTYDIEDVEALLDELKKEADEKTAGLHAAMKKLTDAQDADPDAPDDPSVPPKQGGAPQGGGGAAGGPAGKRKARGGRGQRQRPGTAQQRGR